MKNPINGLIALTALVLMLVAWQIDNWFLAFTALLIGSVHYQL